MMTMYVTLVPGTGLSYNWWGFQAWGTRQVSTDNSSIDMVETSLELKITTAESNPDVWLNIIFFPLLIML